LESAGIDRISVSANKQWLQFDATALEAEQLLKTRYHFYEHTSGNKATIGCDEYSVPEHVRPHIDYITPGIKLYTTTTKSRNTEDLVKRSKHKKTPKLPPILGSVINNITTYRNKPLSDLCQVAMVPECIAALYKIPKAHKATPGNELGIFEDIGDVYSQEDLDLFFKYLYPTIPPGTHPMLDAIDGATAPNPVEKAGNESNLDFQTVYPIVFPQKIVLYQTDDPVYQANYTYNGFLNNFLDAIDGSYCQFCIASFVLLLTT
jgi:tripeptidyl-peptidase-1